MSRINLRVFELRKRRGITHFLSHRASRKEAEDYCNRNDMIAEFLEENDNASYTSAGGRMITYGKIVADKA